MQLKLTWWSISPTLIGVWGCNLILGNEAPGPMPADSSGGTTGGSSSGVAGGTSAGSASGGSPNTGSVGVIGASCSPNSAFACAARNQLARLMCVEGKWRSVEPCAATERCDASVGSNAGMCKSVVPECDSKEPGAAVQACDGNSPRVCGVDRVSLESVAPCEPSLGCAAGICKPKLAECAGHAENSWVCATSGKERVQCGSNETEFVRQACAGSCAGGWCASPSCTNLAATCGSAGNGNCCESLRVAGGTFYRGTDATAQATVTAFRLDKYEVTVGRFRAFRAAWEAGYRPALGAGKHSHLNMGQGLSDGNGGYEGGWDAAWQAQVNVADSAREGSYTTWTATPSGNENLPINYVSWFEGFAFCVWDGGFLPSETEWEYAAAGGSEERTYPWGTAAPDCDRANFVLDGSSCSGTSTHSNPVGSLPLGDGVWKHSDLGGNVREWCLDLDAPLTPQCSDCVQLATGTLRSCRGGANAQNAEPLAAAARVAINPTTRATTTGFRCARAPQ
jgi:formylglycine-generating enzyme